MTQSVGDSKKSNHTGSHPVIKFEQLPVAVGQITTFNKIRTQVVNDVVQETLKELQSMDLELLLGETLFQERQRLRRVKKYTLSGLYTTSRRVRDQKLWSEVKSGLLKGSADVSRSVLLEKALTHFAEEIAGRFSPRVYKFATLAVPWMFSWLLNVASMKRFLPWGMTHSLESRLRIVGEVPALQNLYKKGTILLVPTHQSNIDSLLIGYVIYLMGLPPFAYGAGLNLFMNPIFSFFMGNLGAYTVDRQKNNFLYKSVLKNYSTQILRQNVHSIFFPGGGRSRSGAIESKLKLGLLGTAIEAQVENLRTRKENPNIYVVPMTTSYDFVLEASSLVEDYLYSVGKHRFMGGGSEEPPQIYKFFNFFWKLFSAETGILVRLGKPMDVFGNLVDENGVAMGPNGTTIDARAWLTSGGELKADPKRDAEYTRQLGNCIVDRYYKENTVLTSHLVAFTLFISLRKRYPELDLYRFLRLSDTQRRIPLDEFMMDAENIFGKIKTMADRGELFLCDELYRMQTREWITDGIQSLGVFHSVKVVFIKDNVVGTEDMSLLYYYRNRLSGYGISLLGELGKVKKLRGETDEQGFLA